MIKGENMSDSFTDMWNNIQMVRRLIHMAGLVVTDQTEIGSSVTLLWENPETGQSGNFYFDFDYEEQFVPYSEAEIRESLGV